MSTSETPQPPQSRQYAQLLKKFLLTSFLKRSAIVILHISSAYLVVNGKVSLAFFILATSLSLATLVALTYCLHDEAVSNSFLLSQYIRGAVPFYLLWKMLCVVLFPLTLITQVITTLLSIMIMTQSINIAIEVFPELGKYLDNVVDFLVNLQPDLTDILWSTTSDSTQVSTTLRSPKIDVRVDLNMVLRVFNVILFATPGVLAMELCKWFIFRYYIEIVLRQYSTGVRISSRGIVACGCIGALGLITQDIYAQIGELFPNDIQSITGQEGSVFAMTSLMNFLACMSSQALVAIAEAERVVLGMPGNVSFAILISFCFNWVFHALSSVQSYDVALDRFSQRVLATRGTLVLGFCTFVWMKYCKVVAKELEEKELDAERVEGECDVVEGKSDGTEVEQVCR